MLSSKLRQNGFAPRIYHRDDYDDGSDNESNVNEPTTNPSEPRRDFNALLSCYVSSGIPVIVAIEDDDQNGHAVVCIGYETKSTQTGKSIRLDEVVGYKQLEGAKRPLRFFDLDQIPRRFMFIDDNHPEKQDSQ